MPLSPGSREEISNCPLQEIGCKKVQEVGESIKEQGKAIIRIEATGDATREDMSEIKRALLGNGREGLCDRVTRVEGKTKFNMWFSLLVIGAVFTALIVVIVNNLGQAPT